MPLSPDTQDELVPLEVAGVPIQVCSKTGGIWFSEEALGQIKRASSDSLKDLDERTAPGQEAPPDDGKQHMCPVDGSPLTKYRYMGRKDIVLEQCLRCGGIWVPHHELDKMIINAPDAESDKKKAAVQEALGQFAFEHEKTLSRFEAFNGFCDALKIRGWWL